MDGFGGMGLAAKIAGFWPKGWGDARNQGPGQELDQQVLEGEVLEPGQGPGGRPASHGDYTGGWSTSSDILGGFTYRTDDGRVLHGQEAMDAYEENHPGEMGPHDGITNESGMYWGESQWQPALGSGGGRPAIGGGWGAGGGGWGR